METQNNIPEENLPIIQEDADSRKPALSSSSVIAGSIIIAALLISGSILYTGGTGERVGSVNTNPQVEQPAGDEINLKPVSKNEHIRGDFGAPITIVEYSDLECPFCKRFHETMKQAMAEYDGKIAWVYRHFPLTIHPKAAKEAEATECAWEQGGNTVFWKYVDRIFEITPANNGLDPQELTNTAKYLNLDVAKFTTCLDSGKYADEIAKSIQEGSDAEVNGTPASFIVVQGGSITRVNGAVPYATLKGMIDTAIAESQK